MEYYLLDVKRTVNVNGMDVAFDYMNTYYYPNEAIKEAMALSMNAEVLHVSVHRWFINKKGDHLHDDGPDGGILYRYEKSANIIK